MVVKFNNEKCLFVLLILFQACFDFGPGTCWLKKYDGNLANMVTIRRVVLFAYVEFIIWECNSYGNSMNIPWKKSMFFHAITSKRVSRIAMFGSGLVLVHVIPLYHPFVRWFYHDVLVNPHSNIAKSSKIVWARLMTTLKTPVQSHVYHLLSQPIHSFMLFRGFKSPSAWTPNVSLVTFKRLCTNAFGSSSKTWSRNVTRDVLHIRGMDMY